MSGSAVKRQAFPQTMHTWLARSIDGGPDGLDQARRHIMEVYAWPLEVYYRGSSFNDLGDAADAVNGFFADRLSRPDFLRAWLDSGRRLRFWLIVGFTHYLKEQRRATRARAGVLPPDRDAPPDPEPEPALKFRLACGRSLVARAASAAAESCAAEGLDAHWRVFARHALDQTPYAQIAHEMAIEERRARVMARTAANRFRSELRARLQWPGASPEDIDADIASLLEDLSA